ncbi:hypothetical protein D3C75_1201740 [compost metagenome]
MVAVLVLGGLVEEVARQLLQLLVFALGGDLRVALGFEGFDRRVGHGSLLGWLVGEIGIVDGVIDKTAIGHAADFLEVIGIHHEQVGAIRQALHRLLRR